MIELIKGSQPFDLQSMIRIPANETDFHFGMVQIEIRFVSHHIRLMKGLTKGRMLNHFNASFDKIITSDTLNSLRYNQMLMSALLHTLVYNRTFNTHTQPVHGGDNNSVSI